MSTEKDSATEALIKVIGPLAIIALMVVYQGWFVSILWGWFMVPIFKLVPLSMPQAIGVVTVVSAIRPRSGSTSAVTAQVWVNWFVAPLIGLAIGFVVKQYA